NLRAAAAEQDRVERQPLERRVPRDSQDLHLPARRSEAAIELRRGRRRDEGRRSGLDLACQNQTITACEPARRMQHVNVTRAVVRIERPLDAQWTRMTARHDGPPPRGSEAERKPRPPAGAGRA